MRLVLASASPRRRELLRGLNLVFDVRPADVDETPRTGEAPALYVKRLARQKAGALASAGTVVVAADTVVVCEGEILGKPDSRSHALETLNRLRGRSHDVLTGVCVIADSTTGERREASGMETTRVTMRQVAEERIDAYLLRARYSDKAGGYALLGASSIFADHVEGSVTNVVGLPLPLLDQLCAQINVDLLSFS